MRGVKLKERYFVIIMIIVTSNSQQNRQTHLLTGRKCNLRVNVVFFRMVCGERERAAGMGDMMVAKKYSCYCCYTVDDGGMRWWRVLLLYKVMWWFGFHRLYLFSSFLAVHHHNMQIPGNVSFPFFRLSTNFIWLAPSQWNRDCLFFRRNQKKADKTKKMRRNGEN